jgi:hypothetical protein
MERDMTRQILTTALFAVATLGAASTALATETMPDTPAATSQTQIVSLYNLDAQAQTQVQTQAQTDWILDSDKADETLQPIIPIYMRDTNTVDFNLAGPIRFSVMEELVQQRFQNNVNDRGPVISTLDSQQYLRTTLAAANVKLTF